MAEDLVLFSMFEGSFPDEWRTDPEFSSYLAELTSFSKNRLTREPALIKEEQECVLNSTQKLAFDNYKTFIQTAECSGDVFREFMKVESHVDQLVDKIPGFSAACKQFGKQAQEISAKRKLNSLALSQHTQLLEILEIPQLMETCVRNGYYEEALELSTHVRRMVKKHSNIPIVKNIGSDSEQFRQLMLTQLVQQLQGSLALPVCLRLVGLLRRMNVFSETELRLKFLQARDHWLQSVLSTIPKDDPYLHISKTIEACRVHLFDIVTQYKALFPDDDSILAGIHGNTGRQSEGALFCGWLNTKIWQFLCLLESDLSRGVGGRVDSLLSQCMYFGLSFSRVGADFRPLIMPVFVKVSLRSFQHSLRDAKHQFHEAMKHFTLTHAIPPYLTSSSLPIISPSTYLSPPHSLLSYQPFEILTNALVAAFNTLRACAPLALAPEISREVDRLLQSVVHDVGEYHRIEHESFTQAETQGYTQFCRVVILDFLPFIERCVNLFFPNEKVQQVASCTVVPMRPRDEDSSSLKKKQLLNIGINARTLAEPLRAVVPELFEEIENEERMKSVSEIQDLLRKEELTGTNEDSLHVTIETTSPVSGVTSQLDPVPSSDQLPEEATYIVDEKEAQPLQEDNILANNKDNQKEEPVNPATEPIDTSNSGWGDFAFDEDNA